MQVSHFMTDSAVRWANPSPDGYGGYTFDAPDELDVRWLDKQEWFRDNTNTQILSNAVVFSTTQMTVGERIYKGSLSDLDSSSDYYSSGVFTVKKTFGEKDTDGNVIMWKAWL